MTHGRALAGGDIMAACGACHVAAVTEDGELFGRTQWDAPDIDNIVFLSESEDDSVPRLEVGQMRRCVVTGRSIFDLEAVPVV